MIISKIYDKYINESSMSISEEEFINYITSFSKFRDIYQKIKEKVITDPSLSQVDIKKLTNNLVNIGTKDYMRRFGGRRYDIEETFPKSFKE